MNNFVDILSRRVLVLDGAMGTFIKKYNLRKFDYHKNRFVDHKTDLFGLNEVLNLTYPDLIKEIHEKYLKAGADIIETNTIRANEYFMEKYDLQGLSYEINFTAAKLAREVATKYSLIRRNKPRFVFGSVGQTKEEISQDDAELIYSQQFKALIAGKVDAILFETFISPEVLLNALKVLDDILKKRGKTYPVVISATVTDENDSLFVDTGLVDEIRERFTNIKLVAVGENCGLGPEEVLRNIRSLSSQVDLPVIAYPNAGLTYDEPYTAAQFAAVAKKFLDEELVNIIGGCCGTTPEYIELIANLAKDAKPRPFKLV